MTESFEHVKTRLGAAPFYLTTGAEKCGYTQSSFKKILGAMVDAGFARVRITQDGWHLAYASDGFGLSSAGLAEMAGVTDARVRQLAPEMAEAGLAVKDRRGAWRFKSEAARWLQNRPRIGDVIIDETIGDEGVPGQQYDVLKIRVKVTRNGFLARAVGEHGSNQGFLQPNGWYAEHSGRGDTVRDAVEDLIERLEDDGRIPGDRRAAVRSLIAEYEAERDG